MKKLIEHLRNLCDAVGSEMIERGSEEGARGMIEPGSDKADTPELLGYCLILGSIMRRQD